VICQECEQAKQTDWHGFQANCQGCKARSFPRSPMGREAYLASEKLGRLTPEYRDMLLRVGVTHDEVKNA
jgi:hypothetical protein